MSAREFIRDNGDKLEVDVTYRFLGHDHLEITEVTAWLWSDRNDTKAPNVTLTDAEDQRLLEELYADPATWEYEDDY